MNRKTSNLILTTGAAAVAAAFAMPSQAVIIVNDNFADGDRANTGALQGDFYGSSTSGAIESNAGSIGLVSGSSGRQIHGLFPTVTLANTGDEIVTSFTFVTPTTTASGNEDIRFGIFDHLGRDTPTQLRQDTSYSSGTPNSDYSGLPGYYSELDVESADAGTNLNIRRSQPSTTGRFISTSSGFDNLGSSSDIGYAIGADTVYTATISAIRTAGGGLDVTTTFLGNSFTVSDAAPSSFDFNMLGYGASSGAFGSSNSAGDPDNGLDITNVTVEFNPVPEPSTALLGLAGGLMLLKRRKA